MPEVIFTGPAGRLEGRFHPIRVARLLPLFFILIPNLAVR